MDQLAIFGAKYLFLLAPIVALVFLYRASPEVRKGVAVFGLLSLPLTYVIGLVARSLYENPRPFVVENIKPLIDHVADNGFPSDHLLLLAGLATLISFFDKKLGILFWVIALLVGISRVYAQVHHWTDILGSIVIALIVGGVVHFVLEARKKV